MGSLTSERQLGFRWVAISPRWPALVLLVLGAACGGPAARPSGLAADEWRTFGGNWTATGTRTTLDMGSDHRASIVHMNGSLVLAGENRPGVGFKAEIVGFTDSQRGMVGRSVWTDERGDKVFSELTGEWVGTGNRISGTFLGGTGRYAGATGEYEFQWQYVLTADDGTVSGRTVGLKGRVRVAATPASPPSAG